MGAFVRTQRKVHRWSLRCSPIGKEMYSTHGVKQNIRNEYEFLIVTPNEQVSIKQ